MGGEGVGAPGTAAATPPAAAAAPCAAPRASRGRNRPFRHRAEAALPHGAELRDCGLGGDEIRPSDLSSPPKAFRRLLTPPPPPAFGPPKRRHFVLLRSEPPSAADPRVPPSCVPAAALNITRSAPNPHQRRHFVPQKSAPRNAPPERFRPPGRHFVLPRAALPHRCPKWPQNAAMGVPAAAPHRTP